MLNKFLRIYSPSPFFSLASLIICLLHLQSSVFDLFMLQLLMNRSRRGKVIDERGELETVMKCR